MKSFEQWWIKYYKVAVFAGIVFLIFRLVLQGPHGFDVKSAIIYFAILTSPLGALFGQILEWLYKLLKILVGILVEFIKLRKQGKKK